jgi:diguanylate cyclase (GGDEF)-like protein
MTVIDREWTAAQLRGNLERVLSPAVCFRINDLLRQSSADYTDIVAVAMADPYVSAKIVAMANLAQGERKPLIRSLHRALQVLGTRHTHMLLMSIMLAGPLLECRGRAANLDLRRWVLALGAAGEWIGAHATVRSVAESRAHHEPDDYLVGGLLLGLGVLILHAGLGPTYETMLGSPPSILNLRDAEVKALGTTHDRVTFWALDAMQCPPELGVWSDDRDDAESVLCRRAVEMLASAIAQLDPGEADGWLADGLPRLGIDPSSLFGVGLFHLRRRVAALAEVFEVDVGSVMPEDHPKRFLRDAGATIEALLGDKLASSEAMGTSLHQETITAIAEEVAVRQAEADPLTGVYNRRGLQQWLRQQKDRVAGAAGLLMVDIDRFKEINDTWGHAAGDRVLVQVARVLQGISPAPLAVGRLGGDEFVAIYPTAASEPLTALAAGVVSAVARKPLGDQPAVTVSAGGLLCHWQHLLADWDGCLAKADGLLYEAKHAGRNSAVVGETSR